MTPEWERAARSGDASRLRAMIEAGLDVDAIDRYGQTALMLTAMHGHGEAARLLIAAGADLDRTAKYRLSALMLAVINNHVEIVRSLVQAGADTELRGSGAPGFHQKTALDLAAAQGHEDIMTILRAARQSVEPTSDES